MSVPVRLAAFAVAVAAAFGLGLGIGDLAGPFEEAPTTHDQPPAADPHGWHEGDRAEDE